MSNRQDLECAIQDAFHTSEIAFLALGSGLGFDQRKPPVLTEEQCSVVYWCLSDLTAKIRACHEIFFENGKEPTR